MNQARVIRAVFAMRVLVCGAALLFAALAGAAAAPWDHSTEGLQPIPQLTGRVVDATGTLSQTQKDALESKLADWEARTANQLVVLLVPTTQPEPIESFSLRVAEAWKIGRRGKDNGAVFVVAKNDKKMRIEVGYGLEGTLTDVTARRIIGDTVAPLFSKGQFAEGISAGVDRIIEVVGSGAPLPPASQQQQQRSRSGGFDFPTLLILLFIVVPVVGRVLRGIFGKLLGSLMGAGIVGFAAWVIASSLVIAIVAAVIGFFVMIFTGFGSGLGRGRAGPVIFPGGGWGGGFGGGGGGFGGGSGGGFSGGGGSFGGGGASGGWN